ncbi:MAG: carbamoyl-phosphate synthase subunit L, partial [Chitinophagaceae bacterium]|nr:carbamoyl-phosphate synthase subunit L [Chitinophagaceae bacterium]
ALMQGTTVKSIVQSTGIDRWFIFQIQQLCRIEKELAGYSIDTLPEALLREAKVNGFSDIQISRILQGNSSDEDVLNKRNSLGIKRVYKMVDTCSAEFEAKTPYFYSTFEG